MTKKLKAVEVLQDKLWITYDEHGNKSGTMRFDHHANTYLLYFNDNTDSQTYSSDEVINMFEFEGRPEKSSWHQRHVFGYPVSDEFETFKMQEKHNLPCFTKTEKSKIYFAAGYYGINFDNGGWMESFCPKTATLKKYQYVGPFKTELDASIAVKRKKRDYE